MLRLKPTTIIALDPYSAGFAEMVLARFKRAFPTSGNLIQAVALNPGDAGLSLETDLASVGESTFDLAARNTVRMEAGKAQALFEHDANSLEPSLIELFGAGRRAAEIAQARRDGIEIVRNRMVYLLVSSSESFARGVILELVRLIRLLFARFYTEEPYSLHVVVMLPSLFEHPRSVDYAATYALLKTLDQSASSGMVIGVHGKMPPFDGCWLIDGTNARGNEIGTLAEELHGYTDAFVGFLTADPELSGALTGTRTARGKVPAYSTFGHGELFFPAITTIKRLSAAMARDIVTRAFLGNVTNRSSNKRRSLLDAKRLILSPAYNSAMNGLERDKGALIWRDFSPLTELQSGQETRKLVAEFQRRHSEFEREALPEFQRALLQQSETVQTSLVALLDAEIDRRTDSAPDGLSDAIELMERLVDPNIALQADAVGERPQNLMTELRIAEGALDQKLAVTIDNDQTKNLLDQVNELRSRVAALETTLRLTSVYASGRVVAKAAGAGLPEKAELNTATTETTTTGASLAPDEEQQRLIAEIDEAKLQIETGCSEYARALIEEERAAYHLRHEAKDKTREAKKQSVIQAEREFATIGDQLGEAKRILDDRLLERREFLMRHFVYYPAIATIFIIVPEFLALFGITLATAIVGFVWLNLFGFLFAVLVAAIIYTVWVLIRYTRGINRQVIQARERVDGLESSLRAAIVQLRRARSDQTRLEYELYAQGMRVEALNRVIEAAQERISELHGTFTALNESREIFARNHSEAVPASSAMRIPIFNSDQIDAYYTKEVPEIQVEAETFAKEKVKRSQVRRLSGEDFRVRVETFTKARFDRLAHLSIEDVLLREPELVSPQQVMGHLQELDNASEPLVQLRDIGADGDVFAQRDVTLWAGTEEHQRLLDLYRKVNSRAIMRPSEDEKTLRSLTRCLNFPAYLLGQVEHYRACYERDDKKDAEELPDLIPGGLAIGPEVRRAYEQLLLAIAIGVVSRGENGDYILSNGTNRSLGNNRRKIAENFATDFAGSKVYVELCTLLNGRLSKTEDLSQSVIAFLDSAIDLESFEREVLETLAKKYHPLR
jgi:hypothetical protein